jgi:hypothetical protein
MAAASLLVDPTPSRYSGESTAAVTDVCKIVDADLGRSGRATLAMGDDPFSLSRCEPAGTAAADGDRIRSVGGGTLLTLATSALA